MLLALVRPRTPLRKEAYGRGILKEVRATSNVVVVADLMVAGRCFNSDAGRLPIETDATNERVETRTATHVFKPLIKLYPHEPVRAIRDRAIQPLRR